MMANNNAEAAITRLRHDYLRLKSDPVPYVIAEPLPTNFLDWHYVMRGPEDSPYEGGFYHGQIIFPREFPFKPPTIYMITPNGRFKPNARLCLSISDYHPETWNPGWNVSTILMGLLSFMLENTRSAGCIISSDSEKQSMALKSLEVNLANKTFCELFPQTVEEIKELLKHHKYQSRPESPIR